MKRKLIYAAMLAPALFLTSCKETFIERPSLSGTTTGNYYNNAEEVRAATSTLYSGLPWRNYESRAQDAIGDVMAGNMFTYTDVEYLNFSVSSASERIGASWGAFYKIIGYANVMIKTFEEKKAAGGNASYLDPAIAEAHYIRGMLYFFIARTWGAAPIITDPGATALSGNFNIPRYLQKDVLRFALEEMQMAEKGLPESDVPGRLTKYVAKGMMAKLYLYQKDYANAKAKAEEVINSGKYMLVSDYQGMFTKSSMNNNAESLFSIQHQFAQDPWGTGNIKNPDRGAGALRTAEADAWEMYVPSVDMLKEYEFGDLRRKWSVMEQGWTNPNWKPQRANAPAYNAFMANGFKYDTLQPVNDGGSLAPTRANIVKYFAGPGKTFGGDPVLGQNSGNNVVLLRYADILLIYAEAVLGSQGSTSDAKALDALNKVRSRAGLPAKSAITNKDILHERRVEFAFEGDYWYDIQRQGYAAAKAIIDKQDRGTKAYSNFITNFSEDKMFLPIPAGEIVQDPELGKDPVPYYK
ncbi:RagB/SusD family nutrient uptake outer membrane protein [Fibrivirga algicola]|uniref:RagB/SusD family nutrient uptake outer membrane protein n=1 Tax=Fibrivirga algicola TaxID=2950420 RepID=A0ABX0QFK8_9BACT|nr:RagB/SusD family nutrient uptake outer membrane protein [Fibrivirga algicola]ARK10779.1 carbohydrate-binding protein SusD [Fibrella sp. ES10-3-2-2]NID09990.1 RagB/SusD family nutrient uptake outer membrane protein [Fibrivirga algicola]